MPDYWTKIRELGQILEADAKLWREAQLWRERIESTPEGPEPGRWFRQVTTQPAWVCDCQMCLVCGSFTICVCPERPPKVIPTAVWGEAIMWNPEDGHPMAWILEDGRIVQPNVQLMPLDRWAGKANP